MANGNIGVGLVMGFGLKRGALASSIAHDSHNIVAVGASDCDIFTAVREVERLQGGGLVIADGGKVQAALPLPIAGLMSDEPLMEVADKLERLGTLAGALGSGLHSPFATLSFLTLPILPPFTDYPLDEFLRRGFTSHLSAALKVSPSPQTSNRPGNRPRSASFSVVR